jgi:hypothetical protein
VAATIALAALAGVALAAPEPVGPDFRISSLTAIAKDRDAFDSAVAGGPGKDRQIQ